MGAVVEQAAEHTRAVEAGKAQPVDDAVHAHERAGEAVADDPVRPDRLYLVRQGRAGQKGLGGDASDVETDTAKLVSLYTSHVQSELGATDGRNITARASTYDEYVEVVFWHCLTSFESGPLVKEAADLEMSHPGPGSVPWGVAPELRRGAKAGKPDNAKFIYFRRELCLS